MRVTFQKRYRAHKNGDEAAQRESSYQKKNGAEGREIERAERERERNINLKKEKSRFFFLWVSLSF